MSDIDELKNIYTTKQKSIDTHKEKINVLEHELDVINKQIVSICTHQWEYERPCIYEKGYYYCSICGTTK